MKKIVTKYWLYNLLLGLGLYVCYRISIMAPTPADEGFFSSILQIANIALALGFSLFYLLGVLLCSFTIFFNLAKKIRDNYFLSWFSFSGLAILFCIYLCAGLWNTHGYQDNVLVKTLAFSALYAGLSTITFIRFQKVNRKFVDQVT